MVYPFFFFTMKEGVMDAEYRITNRFGNTGCVNEKYVSFRQRKKMRDFLGYAGYFRASRYGKHI